MTEKELSTIIEKVNKDVLYKERSELNLPEEIDINLARTILLCREYYSQKGNETGGNLHNILDDGNFSYSDIEFCRELTEKENDLLGNHIAYLLHSKTDTENYCLTTHHYQDYSNS